MVSAFDAHAPAAGFRLRGAEKLAFVSEMFDRVAPTYDLLNHFISLGQTTMWRVFALSWLHDLVPPNAKVLDVGCGTGWVTWYFRKRYRSLNLDVEGMDCSQVMLEEARKINPTAEFTHGDVCCLRYDSDSFHLVTTVYTLRNFPDLRKAVEEMYRVTKPGGSIVILDAFPPQNVVVSSLLYLWLEVLMPMVVSLIIKDKKAYNYLSASIRGTIGPEIVQETFSACGAQSVKITKYTFGTAARIVAKKPLMR